MENQEQFHYLPESKLTYSLRSNGYLFPILIEQVKFLEANHQDIFQNIPSSITSAADIINRGIISFEANFRIQINEETQDNLAQAAREGKEIPSNVRDQMLRDRLNATKSKRESD
ncbi:hypothetical protein [Larkinella punicea]|uniref:hypothetical protein n=1 Tax=Larkinella punicea TaxID=2315727 RepID=UPI001403A425|nr:hypothetical protein [Larkinella punicea]